MVWFFISDGLFPRAWGRQFCVLVASLGVWFILMRVGMIVHDLFLVWF
jgi:hypothetical protein